MSKKEEKEIDVDKLINEYECPYMLKQGIKHYFKKYLLLSIICIILTIISTISESFILPSLLNIVKRIINFK